MRKTLVAPLAAAVLLSSVMFDTRAKAMTFATPSAAGVAATNTGFVQKAQYYGYYRPYYGYYRPYYYGPYYRPYYYGYYPYGYYRPYYGYYRPYWGYRRWYW